MKCDLKVKDSYLYTPAFTAGIADTATAMYVQMYGRHVESILAQNNHFQTPIFCAS